MDITLIFPHQLFKSHPAVRIGRTVYLVEEFLFFRQYKFNKKKLVLHRASMKFYADHLIEKSIDVIYIDAFNELADVRKLIPYLSEQGVSHIQYADAADNWLEKRIRHGCEKEDIKITSYKSPEFLNSAEEVADFFNHKKTYFKPTFIPGSARNGTFCWR